MNDHLDNPQAKKFEALGRFAGGIAHDFNNILSVVEATAQQALKELAAGKLQPERLEKMIAAVKRGAGITRQLLSFSQQKISLDQTIDLASALREYQPLLQEAAGEKILVSIETPDTPVWCALAPDEAFQILLNLVTNGRDAMHGKKGSIDILCISEKDKARLVVKDHGQGIAQEILAHIFDPFFTTKPQGKGTGLGLSVVHGIVTDKKGSIAVDSKLGRGTAFTIDFPIALAPEQQKEQDIKAEAMRIENKLEGKTVLLAEDDDDLREILAITLGDMKMKVMTASNGNEAYQIQKQYEGDIDFLLSDIIMPEMDGVELSEAFQHDRPESNIVLMSGHPFARHREGKSIPEETPLIAKPLDGEMVRKVLERAMQVRDEEKHPKS